MWKCTVTLRAIHVGLRILKGRYGLPCRGGVLVWMMLMVPFLIVSGLSGCSESTEMEKAREAITAECEALGGKIGGLSDYWLGQCIKQHMHRYAEGEPSFATHSKKEVFEYDDKRAQPEVDERRANNPDLLKHIEEKCNQAGVLIFVIKQMKDNGKNKDETVSLFEAQIENVKDPSLGELIVKNTVMRSIDKVYMEDVDVGTVAVDAIKQCQGRYESAMFLR